jgi:uncharacterized coiled-coil protein SlyX
MRTQEEKIAEVKAQLTLVKVAMDKKKKQVDNLPPRGQQRQKKLKEYLEDYSRLEQEYNRLVNLLNIIK